ncbi:hypothetical protein CPAST_c25130 [Clostridium pasteurianum DSM 525 = ATCC 6013]|uniref:Uncharacterized protein n=1 Tax=Clostridium pasteurianum DSM 525 = ATCC 6013 TaxID=1262449 RepID=A0A0H3J5V7_CLOPA|nr:hypothetical protein [Clostridium pasteurianum]AJA48582.1 hypothetical protein CPAST_c25130 [Clostridium pasteurianum DSM 525 = ATCC 6013]AJA52570.1 hypothetical protein CLPA_c25130 [Clostridium pasteurianum DSM 525 = ATCC 6013]AOZ75813.1 hypothetical protein AQ983_12205 [Clostridium pasteurianum DSM 525 = ATCC 6013]AOZ79609.1 hypothetical protein AQ984_12200 [Clostridium pasteurianum]ELP57940.1 hypothetical protein F502_17105 [Clostridium pasteurianum DSM 525 = ATCC 6013]
MLKKYEILLTVVFMGIFAGIYLYVYGEISREASIAVFFLGMLSLFSFAANDNDIEKSIYSLENIEMQ